MSTRLIPPITELTQPYWDAARAQKLVVQQCRQCASRFFPARANCADCGSAQLDWTEVSGEGQVYTFTVAHRPPHPILADQCPLAIAVIELREGPRMISNLVECDPHAITVGMQVGVTFLEIADSDVMLPVFRPIDL